MSFYIAWLLQYGWSGFEWWQGHENSLFAMMSRLALVRAAKDSYPMDIGGAYPGGKAAEALTSIQWRVKVYVGL
jgi:hypothetical protein